MKNITKDQTRFAKLLELGPAERKLYVALEEFSLGMGDQAFFENRSRKDRDQKSENFSKLFSSSRSSRYHPDRRDDHNLADRNNAGGDVHIHHLLKPRRYIDENGEIVEESSSEYATRREKYINRMSKPQGYVDECEKYFEDLLSGENAGRVTHVYYPPNPQRYASGDENYIQDPPRDNTAVPILDGELFANLPIDKVTESILHPIFRRYFLDHLDHERAVPDSSETELSFHLYSMLAAHPNVDDFIKKDMVSLFQDVEFLRWLYGDRQLADCVENDRDLYISMTQNNDDLIYRVYRLAKLYRSGHSGAFGGKNQSPAM